MCFKIIRYRNSMILCRLFAVEQMTAFNGVLTLILWEFWKPSICFWSCYGHLLVAQPIKTQWKWFYQRCYIYPIDILDIVLSYEINTRNDFIDIVIWLVHTFKKSMFLINTLAGNESFKGKKQSKLTTAGT